MNVQKNLGLYRSEYEHDSCGVGFVCNINGVKTNKIIKQGLQVLNKLSHRGATGADPKTGDGAGILIQIPDKFLQKETKKININLPEYGQYATGIIFFPQHETERKQCKDIIKRIVERENQVLIGYRQVPVNSESIGEFAKKTQPHIEQIFIGKKETLSKNEKNYQNLNEQELFEAKLYILRKQIEKAIYGTTLKQKDFFYITNISSRTVIYKGLLMPEQLQSFYIDLNDPTIESSICLVHSRYSTNTFPTWDLAQPFRFLAHNGEINTLRGNINWMRSKEALLKSEIFSKSIKKILPVIVPRGSDSATLDNVFELLVLSGRSMPHAMSMLIPAAWEQNPKMDRKLRAFYQYHSCLMEPWDGPAAVAFSDGIRIGAILDRNGLRPARFIETFDNLLVMASEVGVLDIEPENIKKSGRIEPGKMLFIDTQEKKIIEDEELKENLSTKKPYALWVKNNIIDLDEIKINCKNLNKNNLDINELLSVFNFTREDEKFIIKPMIETGQEPVGAMGNDTPPAVLSNRPKLLFDYFKQLFAQVTNPAIDPIREEIVMSYESLIGPRKNILEETEQHCQRIRVKQPIITNEELYKIRNLKNNNFRSITISTLFKADSEDSFLQTIDKICVEAYEAIKDGYSIIILSDKGINKNFMALPSLLALGAVHQYLINKSVRAQISLILETAEPREVHHFALLFGYGAGLVNPYLLFELIKKTVRENNLTITEEKAIQNYLKALHKGLLKILSKMGISTLQSYRAAQIFEALGLADDVINKCFKGTVSRIGGADLKTLAKEVIIRHQKAYSNQKISSKSIFESGGIYQWKTDGEKHLWNPDTISLLQDAVRKEDYEKFKQFSNLINDQHEQPVTLRSLLSIKNSNGINIEDVEPIEQIVKRFVTGAMSFGSISRAAHETIAIAMNRLKAKSNTGEGGEDPSRFIPLANGDSKRSAIKQVASGRFGVTTNYLVNADEIQIKIAQGAKPGEGGQLPGHKVSSIIAKTRYTTEGVTLISPPPHHDIYSIEDLAQLIYDLKMVNPKARISVKLVSAIGVGTIAAGVAKGKADMILISGGDGGTGASPISSIYNAGLPWELGLSETHQTLLMHHLRKNVKLQTDGQMRTGRDVAIAALLGADEFGFCTSALVVLGCVLLRHCNLNNCSVGIATQDELLEKRFSGKVEYLINYFKFVAQELREIMASLGFRKLDDMIGHTELLYINKDILPWKAKKIDFSNILFKPEVEQNISFNTKEKGTKHKNTLNEKLVELAKDALYNSKQVHIELPITNIDRTAGATLSGKLCEIFGEGGLPEDTIYCKFKGVAGQSFGAWLMKGITFELEGMANDYVGKGISGGKIIIYPYKNSKYLSHENIIIGNTTFYGAINGEAYIRGVAGERFCIRNSGLYAVIEGVGDHGCEYMTGGVVIVLGRTGRNFAAGMSGGIAFVYDIENNFKEKCNKEMIEFEQVTKEDEHLIYNMLYKHYKYTESVIAKEIISNIQKYIHNFVKVMPKEYKRILENKKIPKKAILEVD